MDHLPLPLMPMRVGDIHQFCNLPEEGQSLMRAAMTELNLSASVFE
jgi:hypothetical protein